MQIYLVLNGLLYAGFALWCTVSAVSTSRSLGYLELSPGGRSEYLVIYGGLQLGLAIMFAVFAREAALWRTGVLFSLVLYAPIVAYRVVTLAMNWPVASLTMGTAVLEAALLIGAAILYFAQTSRS